MEEPGLEPSQLRLFALAGIQASFLRAKQKRLRELEQQRQFATIQATTGQEAVV